MLPLDVDEVIRLSLLILLCISFNLYHFIPSTGINSPVPILLFSFLTTVNLIGCILFLDSFESFRLIVILSLFFIDFWLAG